MHSAHLHPRKQRPPSQPGQHWHRPLWLQAFVPAANERPPIFVPVRAEDQRLSERLGAFALAAIQEIDPIVGLGGK